MILQLANLTDAGSAFSGSEPVSVLVWPEIPGEIIRPAGSLDWNIRAKLFGDELFIEGEASAPFSGICARCGCDLDLVVAETLCFSLDVSGIAEVDLTSEIRDAILLALPNHPVCAPTCRGRCSRCGKLLAEGDCDCREAADGSLWNVFDDLGCPPSNH